MKSRKAKFCFAATSSLLALMLVACTPKAKSPANGENPSAAQNAAASREPASLFNGTSLTGWHSVGSANWSVDGGSITGHAQNSSGWLFLDQGYQDFVMEISFQCGSDCNAGALVRAAKTGDGLSGIYIPLGGSKMGQMYRAHIGADNTVSSMTPMPAPPVAGLTGAIDQGPCAPYPCSGIRDAKGGSLNPGSVRRPVNNIQLDPNGWNKLAITMRGDVLIATINGTRLSSAQMDNAPLYGQVALQVAGSSTVKFKDANLFDLTQRVAAIATPYTSPDFRKQQISDGFYSEGVSVGDINRDGHMDIISGPFYYEGPDFTIAREIYAPETAAWASTQSGLPEEPGVPGMGALPPKSGGPAQAQAGAIVHGFYSTNFLSWVYDFNGDGWPDVLVVMGFGARPTFSAHLFINPKGEKRSWDNYLISPVVADEFDTLADVDGDGKPELIMRSAKNPDWTDAQTGILKPDWADVTKPWKFTPISEPGKWGGHGGGVGDINGDGKVDIVNSEGWWENPGPGGTGLWKYNKQRFGIIMANCGPGCGGGEIGVYDINGDGLTDVVTGLSAHGPGLAWYEQQKNGQDITWKLHTIMGAPTVPMSQRNNWEETDKSVAFTELHAESYADMNGDGIKDVVTGKRWWSHGIRYEENESTDPAVVYWFEVKRNGKDVQWIPHLIDNASGVGTQIVATDVNGDGKPDVVTTARKGTFLFFNNLSK